MGNSRTGDFVIRAKRVFLTYPRTTVKLTPEAVLTRLQDKVTEFDYTISQEKHSEGGSRPYHIHALLEFPTRLHVRRADFFDISWYNRIQHPNIQKARKRQNVLDYIVKDGHYITSLDEVRADWQVLVEDCSTYKCLLQCLLKRNPNTTSYVTTNRS